ncbi:SUMF1/EgtB/PvdO family nonheme iron enzyme [bacterium]|nr:SUMF1/EgtB/PvdO family nonheme iron enzyme [bacterium]MBU1959088.1 SUMF1/EgtB/PvdO family nonheme iron enzyme [bacterium]
MDNQKIPKVFISYSWDEKTTISDDVWELAEKFCNHGIKPILDQDHGGASPTPDGGWRKWMQDNIEIADYILIVCTEAYYNKISNNVEVCAGRGVKREWLLIDNQLYDGAKITNYIPIYYEKDNNKFIPTVIKNDCTSYIIDSDKSIIELINYLNGNNKKLPPVKNSHDKVLTIIQNKEEINIVDKYKNVEVENVFIKKDDISLGKITLKTVPIEVDGRTLNVSIYPVTFEQYDLFCEENEKFPKINSMYLNEERSEYPVINISWENAEEYCKWLSSKISKEVRLLYWSEWNLIVENSIPKNNFEKYITYSCTELQKNNRIEKDILGLSNIIGNIYEWCWDGNKDKKYIKGLTFSDKLEDIDKLLDYKKMIRKSTKNLQLGFRIVF